MKSGAPTVLLFLVSLALALMAVIGRVRPDLVSAQIADASFWLLVAAYGVLAIGALFRGN